MRGFSLIEIVGEDAEIAVREKLISHLTVTIDILKDRRWVIRQELDRLKRARRERLDDEYWVKIRAQILKGMFDERLGA